MYSSAILNDIEICSDRRLCEVKSKKGARLFFSIDDENIGIAHQVIDEYREVYYIYSGTDENNYIKIEILLT